MDPCTIVGAAGGAVIAVVLVPAVVTWAGFTAGGIAGGSLAAKLMSWAAMANGGEVVAGSLVAILQSIGAGGLSSAATAVVGSVGAAVGGLFGGSACTSANSGTTCSWFSDGCHR